MRPPGEVHPWPPATSEFLQGRWSNHWCALWFSRRVLQGSHFSCGGHSLYGHLVFLGMFTLLGFTVFLGRASQYLLQLFLVTVPTPGCLASWGARRNLKIRRRDFREVGQETAVAGGADPREACTCDKAQGGGAPGGGCGVGRRCGVCGRCCGTGGEQRPGQVPAPRRAPSTHGSTLWGTPHLHPRSPNTPAPCQHPWAPISRPAGQTKPRPS